VAPNGENLAADDGLGHKRGYSGDSSFWSKAESKDISLGTPPDGEKKKKKKKGKKGDDEEEGGEDGKKGAPAISHIDPDKDTTDPTPFHEKPSRLAMLVDPKSLDDLEKVSFRRVWLRSGPWLGTRGHCV
jgi:hypothetical protein